jgi:hypothetical protein
MSENIERDIDEILEILEYLVSILPITEQQDKKITKKIEMLRLTKDARRWDCE